MEEGPEQKIQDLPKKAAIDQAVEECIREDVLRDFLLRNKAEVKRCAFMSMMKNVSADGIVKKAEKRDAKKAVKKDERKRDGYCKNDVTKRLLFGRRNCGATGLELGKVIRLGENMKQSTEAKGEGHS